MPKWPSSRSDQEGPSFMARAGSTSAPRAQTSAHAGSQYSAPRASITPPQGLRSAGNSTALYHGRKPRGCTGGARAKLWKW